METDYYLVANKRFYEPFDQRPVAAADFMDFVSSKLDGGWKMARKGVWVHCHNGKTVLPSQGWKIHLSTVPLEARRLLEAIVPYLTERGVSFKFLGDARTLRLINAKTWGRGGSGKFVTIYPTDVEHFKRLLAELETLTRGFRGPYILSDRRYKESKVLYYRYGGILSNSRLQPDGTRSQMIATPEGREVEDVRTPTFQPPEWAKDPFPELKDPNEGAALNNGRYAVEKALQFSNSGGVYVALDSVTGRRVVLKEARADVYGFSDTDDAAAMLRDEFAVLKRVEDCGFAPKPVELFQEWEHLFLAEEYLEGYIPLRTLTVQGSFLLDSNPTRESVADYLRKDLGILRQLAAIIDQMHARGVVWGDISFNNILIHPETLDVKIIDLESAHIAGGGPGRRIFTPGFVDAATMSSAAPTVADDYYGFGAVMLHLLTNVNGIIGLKPTVWKQMLEEVSKDFGLPSEVLAVVEKLLDQDPARRPRPSAALQEAFGAPERVGSIRFNDQDLHEQGSREELAAMVRGACDFIRRNADLHRKDRLFPADPLVYQTNPLSLAHGAAGVAYALAKIEGAADPAFTDWIGKAETSPESYPPGLYNGLAGVAWAQWDLGLSDEALATLEKSVDHPLLAASADLYNGLAGWGMTNLRFWLKTGERRFLENARRAGDSLVRTASRGEAGLSWKGKGDVIHYGMAHGSAGIGLFLLSLDRALGGGFQTAAESALAHDLAQATQLPDGSMSWRRTEMTGNIVYPYWKYGAAGVGIVALRFLKTLKNDRYREIVEKIYLQCDRKYTLFPGRNDGLAGIGEFLLDAHLATGEKKFLSSAHKIAAGLKIFAIHGKEGVAFPGNGLARISCDLATGAAGIALFADRLLRPRPADFLLDEALG
ncbi:MAG: class III lanthionine synthetase LanKC [Elusimicrobiota bacterium]